MVLLQTIYIDSNGNNLQLFADEVGTNTLNNSSSIHAWLVLNVAGHVASSNINVSSGITSLSLGYRNYGSGSHVLVESWYDVYHNSDGSGSIIVNGYFHSNIGNWNLSGTLPLTKINRYPIMTGGSDFNDETNPTIKFNSYGTYPIRVKLEVGNQYQLITRDLSNKNATSYTFDLTAEERDKLRALTSNSNTLVVRETVCAMNGDTELNVSYGDYRMFIVNANPTFNNFEFQDTNTKTVVLTGNNQSVVNGYSNIKVTISSANKATAKKKATMSKYRISIGESNTQDIAYSSSASVNTTLQKVKSGVINAYAIDSRGNSTLVTKQATNIINYKPIEKGNIEVTRGNGGIGETVTLKYNGTFDKVNFGTVTNSIKTATYKIQRTDSTVVKTGTTNIKPTTSGKSYSFEGVIAGDTEELGFDISSSYIITVVISDELSSTAFTFTLSSGVPNIALHKNGVGLMGKYDTDKGGLVQVASNPILESGSNDNGSYIKYFDGTLICYSKEKFTDLTIIAWTNTIGIVKSLNFKNFPIKFKGVPIVNKFPIVTSEFNFWVLPPSDGKGTLQLITETNAGPLNIAFGVTSGNVDATIGYIAIGKWK